VDAAGVCVAGTRGESTRQRPGDKSRGSKRVWLPNKTRARGLESPAVNVAGRVLLSQRLLDLLLNQSAGRGAGVYSQIHSSI